MDSKAIVTWIPIIISFAALASIVFTGFQAKEARKSNRAVFLLRLSELWGNHEIYEAVSFINNLRMKWKTKDKDPQNWDVLAGNWVEENIQVRRESTIDNGSTHSKDWLHRRDVVQLLSQMYLFLSSNYILDDDLFGLIPEAKRLLIVLIPIEKAIIEKFSLTEESIGVKWDIPVSKKLVELEKRYDQWLSKQKHL